MLTVRPLRDDDCGALAEIYTAIHPDVPATEEEMRQEVARVDRSRYVSEWLVAERSPGDTVVGYAFYRHAPWAHHPDRYRAGIYVHPDSEGRGAGRLLLEAILSALRARGAARVSMATREDRRRAVAFLERAGFEAYARDIESRLDVAGVDLARFAPRTERAQRLGVTITTLAEELGRDPGALRPIYQLHCVLELDTPRDDPGPPTPPAYEDFRRQEAQHPRTLPDAFFLAKLGDLYIGESYLKRSDGDPGLLHQELTGVLPAYRGMGVATALKLATIAYGQRRGYRAIRTFNSSRNAAMLAINRTLGFVPEPAWIGFVRKLA